MLEQFAAFLENVSENTNLDITKLYRFYYFQDYKEEKRNFSYYSFVLLQFEAYRALVEKENILKIYIS